jgi:hypothetical protein
MTIDELSGSDILLVGHLEIHRGGPIPDRPCLQLRTWCPFCRDHYAFQLPDTFRADHVIGPVAAPCHGQPYKDRAIYVGIDPATRDEAAKVMERFAVVLNRFVRSNHIRRQLAESRRADAAYLSEIS